MPKVLLIKSLFPKRFSGIALWPVIIVKNESLKNDLIFLNHERIHLRQQIEMLVLPYYIFYGLEFFLRLLYYNDWRKAYRNISFEREAYAQEQNLNYLNERKFWAFTGFITKKPPLAGGGKL